MSKLKLVTTDIPSKNNIPYIIDGETPVLAYKSDGTIHVLDKGGSPRSGLVKCSDLKGILDSYMFKGTKYIVSTYNPTLYYLFPGMSVNDDLFNTDNNFIPTLPISDIVRLEVDGFNEDSRITQADIRCMKACDSWLNNLSEYEEIVSKINSRVESIFGYYKEYDISKEVGDKKGSYSANLSEESLVVSLLSETSYTDTINLEDWVLKSKKGTEPISGKLDFSYMYSINGQIYSGMHTIKAFQYEENVTSKNVIIQESQVQIEYMNYVLKIYPLTESVDEVVFTDCTLTIGCLYNE